MQVIAIIVQASRQLEDDQEAANDENQKPVDNNKLVEEQMVEETQVQRLITVTSTITSSTAATVTATQAATQTINFNSAAAGQCFPSAIVSSLGIGAC